MKKRLLSEKFRNFSKNECKGSSDLYEHLSFRIAEDEEILALASHAREGQPVPNLLFGAVHYLLLKGKNHCLNEFYLSIVKNPENPEESYFYFKDFCNQYTDEIIHILKNKLVQTNEVRRCAYLFPTFNYIFKHGKKSLALIEIGTSAGLQLLWDKYSYSYGTNEVFGDANSEVHITAEVEGEKYPFLKREIPPVGPRIGIDLNVLDLTNDEDYLWLNALIWPDHQERRALFGKAAGYVKETSLTLIEGDGVELLPGLSKEIPSDYAICVFHTHVANQMPLEVKEKLFKQVKSIGSDREIFHIYNNVQDKDLHLDYYMGGKEFTNKVGKTEGHGRWFSWGL